LYTEAFSAGRLQGYDEGLAEGLRRIPEPAPTEPAAVSPSLPVFVPIELPDAPAGDRSLPATEPSAEELVGQTVYVTKSGTKYHLGTCSHLSKSKIERSLADAKNAGYEPCKTCNPPK